MQESLIVEVERNLVFIDVKIENYKNLILSNFNFYIF